MKTVKPLVLASIFAALTFATPVIGQVKGGEKLASISARTTESVAPAKKMACKTETVATVDRSARGAFKPVSVSTLHACPSCQTKEKVSGAGKLATHKLAHFCATEMACCK